MYMISNIDCTIICQRPKLRPYLDQMAENVADALGLLVDQVNIKATTEEGLGFTGSGEGISAQAVCLIERALERMPDERMADTGHGCASCPMHTLSKTEADAG